MPSTYPANYCGPNGYTHMPSPTSTDPSDSQACSDAQKEFAVSTAACGLATAGAVGTGLIGAAGAALVCAEAIEDGWDMVDTCGY